MCSAEFDQIAVILRQDYAANFVNLRRRTVRAATAIAIDGKLRAPQNAQHL